MASRPTVIDARHTFKSYQAAYKVITQLRSRDPEAVVELLIKNDKGLLKDVATWCSTTGYKFICSEENEEEGLQEIRCLIQNGEKKRNPKVMTVMISTAKLEEIVYAIDKALGGAVLGMQVNVVFEGTGVRLLKKGYRANSSGFWSRMFTTSTEKLMKDQIGWPLPPEAITMLEELGAEFYVCGPSMVEYGVREEDLVVKAYTIGAAITWVDLLARSNVNVLSRAVFEKP